jgi:hypothetical protein
MEKYSIFILVFSLFSCNATSQEVSIEEVQELEVLQLVEVGSEREFVISTEPIYRRSITLLGDIEYPNDKTYSLLNVVNLTGLTEDAIRANPRIVIYSEGKRIGYYPIGNKSQLPYRLTSDGKLLFSSSENCTDSTVVELSHQIPEKIFLECKDGFGDLIELLDEW